VVVLDGTGHLVMESVIETKAATILQLLHGLSGSLQVTLEEGTCAAWLHDLLTPRLMPTPYVKLYVQTNKSDYLDAEAIAEEVQRSRWDLYRSRRRSGWACRLCIACGRAG
jgi:hypothetical protein